jgi:TNF receptor-associated factor 4
MKDHEDTKCPRRKETCHMCHETIVHAKMSEHQFKCPKVEVGCPNFGCSEKMLREQLDSHKSVCPKQRVPCVYKTAGCNAVMLREDLQQHLRESIELHCSIANNTVSTLRKELADTKNVLESKRVPPVIFKMSGYSQLKESEGTWKSPSFYTHEGGYKMTLYVFYDEDSLGVYIRIASSPNDDKLVWPFIGNVTIDMINQCNDYGHLSDTLCWGGTTLDRELSSSQKPLEGKESGICEFISYADLEKKSRSHMFQYLKNDCVYFRISEASVDTQCKPWLICSP